MVEFLKKGKNAEVVNIQRAVFAALVNIVSSALVSGDMHDDMKTDHKLMGLIDSIVDTFSGLTLPDPFPFLRGLDVWGKQRAKTIHQIAKFTWADTIKERMAHRKVNGQELGRDFLDNLMRILSLKIRCVFY